MGNNRDVRFALHDKYGSSCQLSGSPIPYGYGTYHHLIKDADSGEATIENGTLLSTIVHQWLHTEIEKKNRGLYNLINDCLRLYKYCLDNGYDDLVFQYKTEIMPAVESSIKEKKLYKSYDFDR